MARTRLLKVLAAVAGLILLLVAALLAAAAYYHHTRFEACRTELDAAVASKRTYESFLADPRPDGVIARFSRAEAKGLRDLAGNWTHRPVVLQEIDAKASRTNSSAVFLVGDMVYVLYFDKQQQLADFVCLSN
jgi:hypothetical protein